MPFRALRHTVPDHPRRRSATRERTAPVNSRDRRSRGGLEGVMPIRSPSRARARRVRPSLESLESRVVMDGPGGAAADDGWIQNFRHPLPDPSVGANTYKLGLLKFDSGKP